MTLCSYQLQTLRLATISHCRQEKEGRDFPARVCGIPTTVWQGPVLCWEVEGMVVVVERVSLDKLLWYLEDRVEQSSKFQLLDILY